jgi:exopolysaccharide biosynthesis protein
VKSLLLLLLLNPLIVEADWQVLDRQNWPLANAKLTASELRVTDGATEAEVNLVFFAAADVTLEVVANTGGEIRGLRELFEGREGLAGINGGYFQADLEPVGLLISNDRLVHPLQKANLLSGIFYLRSGRPWLVRTREFPGAKGIQQAIQCGPFLVEGSRTVTGLDDIRVAPRTFIFSCGQSEWGFGICRSVTLKEMGDLLAQTAIVPDHHVVRALNFDGGSSTTFYARSNGRTLFSEGKPVVSNYLIVKAKK